MIDNPTTSSLEEPPLITFALFAYNQEEFIREAVEGAFFQTYSPLEIILSDDFSLDNTYEIMEEMAQTYNGPHKIILNRNENNLGIPNHVNKLLEISSGELIVFAGGDDISLPNRSLRSWEILGKNENSICVSFNSINFYDGQNRPKAELQIKPSINKHSLDDLIEDCEFHIGASRTIQRSAFDYFGPLKPEAQTEDSTILLRCLLLGEAISSTETQVFHRIHSNNYYSSDNKYSIDYGKIHEQYIYDLEKALEIGLIDKGLFKHLEKLLEKRLHRRYIWVALHRPNGNFIDVLFKVLFSRHIQIKEKLSYLKRGLLGMCV